jgi:Fe-S-cluster containining protein
MEHRFRCTQCGACCHGWLPLTITEAVAHAGRFPLAMVWMPVRKGAKAFETVGRFGPVVRLADRRDAALSIAPTLYQPPAEPCPYLEGDGRCGIHAEKPVRCRAMPFSALQAESEQRGFLTPRPGWSCDVRSDEAPVVYRDKHILDRAAYDAEAEALAAQTATIRAYAALVLKAAPTLIERLTKASLTPGGGKVIVGLSPLMSVDRSIDAADFAARQIPVLEERAARAATDPKLAEYHRQYQALAADLGRFRKAA